MKTGDRVLRLSYSEACWLEMWIKRIKLEGSYFGNLKHHELHLGNILKKLTKEPTNAK